MQDQTGISFDFNGMVTFILWMEILHMNKKIGLCVHDLATYFYWAFVCFFGLGIVFGFVVILVFIFIAI